MDEDQLHVVFGTGQVGNVLAAHLASLGIAVPRAVSRHRPPTLVGVDWRPVDVTEPEAAADAAKGASVIYQYLNAPYTQWPERFPPLQRGVLAAAERNGALLVCLENLYGFGQRRQAADRRPSAGRDDRQGPDHFPGGHDRGDCWPPPSRAGSASPSAGPRTSSAPASPRASTLGERVFGNARAGKRADFIGDPDLPHTYSYVPDIAAGLATLGTDARAAGQVWHLPRPGDRHDQSAS